MIGFWDVIDRSESGPLFKEKQFDMQLSGVARRLAQKYDIRYDPQQVVPDDDNLADRLYQAALDLILEVGVYCRDTGRLMQFSRAEVERRSITPRTALLTVRAVMRR
jgi:methylamine--corrinoid protein Co-methyltransferase